jgi:hypothetical protein
MDAGLATDQAIDKAKGAKGRKDAEKQTMVITMEPVKDRIEDLILLLASADEASAKFDDAIKATAEKAGLLAAVVRKFVKARAGEKFEEEQQKVEQLSLIFEEVGQ